MYLGIGLMVDVMVVAFLGVVLLARWELIGLEREVQRLEKLKYGLKGA